MANEDWYCKTPRGILHVELEGTKIVNDDYDMKPTKGKPEMMPDAEANKLVSESIRRFQLFRDEQHERIEYHQRMAHFHEKELKQVDRFLASNFFNDSEAKACEPEADYPSKSIRAPY